MMTRLAQHSHKVSGVSRTPAAVPLRNVTGAAGIDLADFGAGES